MSKTYKYPVSIRFTREFCNLLGYGFLLLAIVWVVTSAWEGRGAPGDLAADFARNLGDLLLMSVFGPIWCWLIASIWSDIEVTPEGLTVAFAWKKFLVKWENICSIRRGLSWPGKTIYVVEAEGLTPFHRLISLVFCGSFSPGFLIYNFIEDYEQLMLILRQHARRIRIKERVIP